MRQYDWPERLEKYLLEREQRDFAWGQNDCCAFAFGAAAAMGLPNPTPIEARRYKTASGSQRVINKLGGTLEKAFEVAMRRAGFSEIPRSTAQRGDFVMVDTLLHDDKLSPALGVVGLDGVNALFVRETGGLVPVPIRVCRRAWRVE